MANNMNTSTSMIPSVHQVFCDNVAGTLNQHFPPLFQYPLGVVF